MKTIFILIFSFWPFSDDLEKQQVLDLQGQAKIHFATNLDSAAIFADMSFTKAEDIGFLYGKARGQFIRAIIEEAQNNTNQAVTLFLDALFLYEAIGDAQYASDRAKIYTTLGKLCWQYNRDQEAIEYYNRGIDLARKAGDNELLIKLLQNLALSHRNEGEYDITIDLLMQRLDLLGSKINKDKLKTFNTLGTTYYLQKQYDKSRVWFNKMMAAETDPNPSYFRGQAYHNLANIYKDEGNYTEAWAHYKKALLDREALGKARNMFNTYQDMAELALLQNQPEVALSYAQKATPLLDQLPDTREYFDQYRLLARCVEHSDPKQALVYNNLYFKKDKAFDEQQQELMARSEGYKLDLILARHEQKLRERAQKKELTATMIYWGLALLILSLMAYVYRDYRKRKLYARNPWARLFDKPTKVQLYLDEDDDEVRRQSTFSLEDYKSSNN